MKAEPYIAILGGDMEGLHHHHPSVVHEYKLVCRLLVGLLVTLGRSADQTQREAEAVFHHMVPARQRSGRALLEQ